MPTADEAPAIQSSNPAQHRSQLRFTFPVEVKARRQQAANAKLEASREKKFEAGSDCFGKAASKDTCKARKMTTKATILVALSLGYTTHLPP
jgi:hypothetical protein